MSASENTTLQKLYTQDEVATLLAVSPSTVRWWRNQGRLEYIKIGRHVRISQMALEDFLFRNSHSVKAPLLDKLKEMKADDGAAQ